MPDKTVLNFSLPFTGSPSLQIEEIGSSFVGLLYSDNDDRNILRRNDANITIKRELITAKSVINNYITHKNLYVVREDE